MLQSMGLKARRPTRTINVIDKGSNYLLINAADATELYNCHWDRRTAPHMRVTRLPEKEPVGNATYIDKLKGGFYTAASNISLTLDGRRTSMNKESGGVFSADKRVYQSMQGTKFLWKGVAQYLGLEDDKGTLYADFKNTAYSGTVMGVFHIYVEPLEAAMMDEIVVTGLAMISEQKTSMTSIAAAMSRAGG